MTILLKKLDKLLSDGASLNEAIILELLADVNQEPAPSELYHYTNDIGLNGILESGALRFTDIFGVNDPSELKHGFSHSLKILEKLAASGSPLEKQFVNRFHELYESQLDKTAHFFICSFSKVKDDLAQWRAYADNGRGYNLVFDGALLENGFAKPNETPSDSNTTFSVRYNDSETHEIHNKIVKNLFHLVSFVGSQRLEPSIRDNFLKRLSSELSVRLIHSAIFYKHEAYMPESEYRFMQIFRGDKPAPNLKERPRSYGMVRYTEYEWKEGYKDALKKIIIGPSADKRKARDFAESCLEKYGFTDVSIEESEIPYRAL